MILGLSQIGDFFTSLGDLAMWRSLGWIVLGVVLILIGLAAFIGPKVGGALSQLPMIPV